MSLPPTADSPERIAEPLLEPLLTDRFLAAASEDVRTHLVQWARDLDAVLPALETR